MSCQFMCVCEDRGRSCLSLTAAIEAFSGLFSFCYFCRFNSYFPLTPTVSCFLNYYLIFKDLIFLSEKYLLQGWSPSEQVQ